MMMRLLTILAALVVLVAFWAPAAQSQDWDVEGEITIEDMGDPGQETNTNSLQNEPKIQGYIPFLEITSGQSNIGFGTIDYFKDSDPFGEFLITITATSEGLLDVIYSLSHECIDVSVGSFMMRSDLSVELIDLGGGGVVLTATGAMMAPGVREEDGLGTDDFPLPSLALAIDEVLNGEGITTYSSEAQNYIRSNTTVAMLIGGRFQLTTGDKAILRGRFEIARDLVPVEATTWGAVKALYTE
jgi:hypothetical protein